MTPRRARSTSPATARRSSTWASQGRTTSSSCRCSRASRWTRRSASRGSIRTSGRTRSGCCARASWTRRRSSPTRSRSTRSMRVSARSSRATTASSRSSSSLRNVMAKPKFSVSQITTFHQTFDEDLASYAEAGVEGVGIWQFKLPEDGNDREALAKLKDSGLKATTMIPGTLSIHPVPFPGPDDPPQRTEEPCATTRRFAPFEPEVVLVLPGAPAEGSDPDEARRVTVEGFRKAAKVAAEYGLTLGMEPLHREIYGTWTTVYTIPQTIDLIDEIGEPNVKVLYDVYHLHD